ncbi:MAG: PSD1 and planctomycete cytochrome C domain-containing protein [Pirellulales bacterium]
MLTGTTARSDEPRAGQAAETPGRPIPTAQDYAFFESRIRPLLVEHCHECHSRQAETPQASLLLDNAAGIARGGDSGPVVVPGRPDDSLLIQAVRYTHELVQMPPAGQLPEAAIAELAAWVARGAPFPPAVEPDGPIAGQPVAGQPIDIEQGKLFWSFRPLVEVPPAPAAGQAWIERRIDAYLLPAMEAGGVSPSPRADRRTLIRRASFDLVGLPPSPEEIDAFIRDDSPDAYARLIERLLASPHYGERWGRYWLDLVRYCDVPEPWAASGAAWLYRDWIVDALNRDLPYDRFVTLQLAADHVPDARVEDIAALGFLGLSPTYWKELKLAPGVIQVVVAEEWEERVNTLTSTLLGVTVACARCHDHKFDPVTQHDYYALAGVLASTRLVPRPLLPAGEAAGLLATLDELRTMQAQVDKLLAQNPLPPEDKTKADEIKAQIEALRKATPAIDEPLAFAVDDASVHVLPDGPHRTMVEHRAGQVQDVPVHIRGNPLNPGDVVPRRFLAVLSQGAPQPFQQGSGRLELAQAIFDDAAPLAARVMVNRVWRHHFGRGLVETPSNFGAQGDRPTHPELLDDLAARFIASGWSLKWLHREIMLSAAWQQQSTPHAAGQAVDPDNRHLWRMNRRRLEVEAWRDAMLAACGTLDRSIGGPPAELNEPANNRRTIYGTVKRRELADLLRLYDFPDPTAHSPARLPTTTPLQQLYVLNSPFIGRQAELLTARLQSERPADTKAQVSRAHQLLFGREPTEGETIIAHEFLAQAGSEPSAAAEAWRQYLEVLLASNELMFID